MCDNRIGTALAVALWLSLVVGAVAQTVTPPVNAPTRAPAGSAIQKGTATPGSVGAVGATPGTDYLPGQDAIHQNYTISTIAFSQASSTTLNPVYSLGTVLSAGGAYYCWGHLHGTAGGSGGIKVALGTPAYNTLTALQYRATGWLYNGTTLQAVTTTTTLGNAIAANTAAYTDLVFDATIVVNVPGMINVQAAQNASNGTATTVALGSNFACVRIG